MRNRPRRRAWIRTGGLTLGTLLHAGPAIPVLRFFRLGLCHAGAAAAVPQVAVVAGDPELLRAVGLAALGAGVPLAVFPARTVPGGARRLLLFRIFFSILVIVGGRLLRAQAVDGSGF